MKYKLQILTRQDDVIFEESEYNTLTDMRAAVNAFFYTNDELNLHNINYYYNAFMWSDDDNDYIGIFI